MKKIGFVLSVFLALSLFAGNVLADGNVSNETDNQAAAFTSGLGAKVRLMQLESAIEKNILWGERIIAAVKEKNATIDSSELETLLTELKVLLEEVNNNTAPAAGDESARHFVDMRHEGNEITKEFRELVHSILKEADIQGMKRALGATNWNNTNVSAWDLNKTRHEYNAEKVSELLNAANITDPALLEKIKNGDMSIGEIRKALKDALDNKKGKEQSDAYNTLSEKAKKSRVFVMAVKDKVAKNESERIRVRVRERMRHAEGQNVTEAVGEKLRNQTRTEKRINRTLEHIEYMTGKKIEKLEDLGEKISNASERKTDRLEDRLDDSNMSDAQRDMLQEKIDKQDNKTERIEEKTDERINKTEEKGENLKEDVQTGNKGNGNGGSKE
jgi:hypothetical protein